MNQREMLTKLGERFPLVVRNQYHIQIQHAERKYTDIWVTKYGSLKVKLFGEHDPFEIYDGRGIGELIQRLMKFDYKSDNDLARMRELEGLMSKAKDRDGIFTDAGWKNGIARIAVIRAFGPDLDITVRQGEFATNVEAEMMAIRLACSLYPHANEIFSDCQPAVNEYNQIHQTKVVKWIDRNHNKEADKLSSMKGK